MWKVDELEQWDNSEIEQYLPHGMSGYDKDGAPGNL